MYYLLNLFKKTSMKKIVFYAFLVVILVSCNKSNPTSSISSANSKKIKKLSQGVLTSTFYYSNNFYLDSIVQFESTYKTIYKFTYNGNLISKIIATSDFDTSNLIKVFDYKYNGNKLISSNMYNLNLQTNDTVYYPFYFKYEYKNDIVIGTDIVRNNKTYIFRLTNNNLVESLFDDLTKVLITYKYDNKQNPLYLIEGFANIYFFPSNRFFSKNNMNFSIDINKETYDYNILYNNLDMPYEIIEKSNKEEKIRYEYY
jgi:hypothetical protein